MHASTRTRARARTHTPRTVDADFEMTQQVHEEAHDEAEDSERRLEKQVKSEPMSPTGQRAANRAAAKKAANRGESTEGSSADETIRERGTKVSTPKRNQRAGSDDDYVLSPKGKGWVQSSSRQHSSPAGRAKLSPRQWGTHEKPSPRRASPRQAAAKEDASPPRRSSPRRLDMTGVAVNAHARKANVDRND